MTQQTDIGTAYGALFVGPTPSTPQNEAESHGGDQDAPWLYWRLTDGRVQLLKGGPNGMGRAMRGDQPLAAYGMVRRASRNGLPTQNDEFAILVQRGGARELSARQTLGLHWHRRPLNSDTWSHKTLWQSIDQLIATGVEERAALNTVLPQLVGVEIPEPKRCEFCHGRLFLTRDEALKHESVMHREDVRTRELRDSITTALSSQNKDGGDMAELVKLMAQTLAAVAGQGQEQKEAIENLLEQVKPPKKTP